MIARSSTGAPSGCPLSWSWGVTNPLLGRLIGVSISPMVGSIYNMDVWDKVAAVWVKAGVRRTLEGEAVGSMGVEFLLSTPLTPPPPKGQLWVNAIVFDPNGKNIIGVNIGL